MIDNTLAKSDINLLREVMVNMPSLSLDANAMVLLLMGRKRNGIVMEMATRKYVSLDGNLSVQFSRHLKHAMRTQATSGFGEEEMAGDGFAQRDG